MLVIRTVAENLFVFRASSSSNEICMQSDIDNEIGMLRGELGKLKTSLKRVIEKVNAMSNPS